jgi:CheY-like chemotaxis protein
MTANAMERDRDECLGAGMNDYLPKPIVKETLLTMIGNWRH